MKKLSLFLSIVVLVFMVTGCSLLEDPVVHLSGDIYVEESLDNAIVTLSLNSSDPIGAVNLSLQIKDSVKIGQFETKYTNNKFYMSELKNLSKNTDYVLFVSLLNKSDKEIFNKTFEFDTRTIGSNLISHDIPFAISTREVEYGSKSIVLSYDVEGMNADNIEMSFFYCEMSISALNQVEPTSSLGFSVNMRPWELAKTKYYYRPGAKVSGMDDFVVLGATKTFVNK